MRIISSTVAATAAAGLIALSGPAFAAGSYTVTAGSTSTGSTAYTASAGTIAFSTSGGLDLGCTSGTAGGAINLGTDADGLGIGSIASSTFSSCTGPLGIPLDVTQTAAWRLNATGTPASGVTPGGIDQISASVSNPDGQCDFDVAGTVGGNFNANDQTLNLTGGAQTLTISNVVGCFGLVNDGDTASFTASYAVSNPTGPIAISQP